MTVSGLAEELYKWRKRVVENMGGEKDEMGQHNNEAKLKKR